MFQLTGQARCEVLLSGQCNGGDVRYSPILVFNSDSIGLMTNWSEVNSKITDHTICQPKKYT